MNWLSTILALGALGSPISLAVLLRQRQKAAGEIRLNKAQESEVVNRAAAINQTRELELEASWQKKLDTQEAKFQHELGLMRAEVDGLKQYINEHIPWDWEAVRLLRLEGIPIDNPPSLIYIRNPEVGKL